MVKRFLALLMCLVFLLSFVLVTPASAASASDFVSGDFFSWVFEAGYHTGAAFASIFVDRICPSAPGLTDKHNFVEKTSTINGKTGLYYVCEYCGKSAGEVGTEAYDAQVEALPATGYQSDGSLLLTVPIAEHGFSRTISSSSFRCNNHSVSQLYSASDCLVSVSCISNSFHAALQSGYSSFSFASFFVVSSAISAPYSGYYQPIKTLGCFGTFVSPSLETTEYSFDWSEGNSVYYEAGATLPTFAVKFAPSKYTVSAFSVDAQFYPAIFKFIPVPITDINFETTYNINSRPTSITGDYGIIGDNGQITKVEGDYIVNETTNNYHNPATGTTTPIVDWSYDYGDRVYTLSLEGGLSASVKYGDDNITINESTVNDTGDTITNNYTIYYLVDGSGTEDPDPSPSPSDPPACAHTWTETSRTEPTCISAGKVTSTCSKCSQTKTETIPATGHTWVVERTVQTTYDDSGNLLQQGYAIYMCSVCGEQYKDVDSTGPPGGGGNDDSDSGVISEIIAKLKAIYDEISETVQGFFGQFTDFLKAVFPFLPEEFFTILLLGALLMVIVAALRKLIS